MKKRSSRPPIMRRVLKYARPDMGYIVLSFVFGILSVLATLLIPIYIGLATDLIETAYHAREIVGAILIDWGAMAQNLIILASLVGIASLFTYFLNICTGIVSHRTTQRLRNACLDKLQDCALSFIDTTPHGDVIARIGVETDVIGDGLLQGFSQLFTGVSTIVGTLIIMLLINVPTAIVVICVTPLSLVVSMLIAKYIHRVFTKQTVLRGEISGLVNEAFSAQKLVKAFNYEAESQSRFDAVNEKLDYVGVRAQFASALANPCTRFVNGIVYAAVALFGALNVMRGGSGAMTVGLLFSFLAYANQYTKPFNEISTVVAELQSAMASAARVLSLIEQPTESLDGAVMLGEDVRGDIDMRHVSFGYTPEKILMKDLNLRVKAGMRVAIVGPTGCGKSTLINLLMRFYDVTGGEILVDGTKIVDCNRNSLRKSFGMVLQETFLSRATIADNIAYGKPDATREEIIAAAKSAHCHRFIELLPNGYDTMIEDDGDSLSVGQKQLLCIARVMLISPPMLILDEATSNIDTRTEKLIQTAFARLTSDKTSFVVAHRFATILDADLILVMRDGDIVETGTHAQLLAQDGFYKTLYESQF